MLGAAARTMRECEWLGDTLRIASISARLLPGGDVGLGLSLGLTLRGVRLLEPINLRPNIASTTYESLQHQSAFTVPNERPPPPTPARRGKPLARETASKTDVTTLSCPQ